MTRSGPELALLLLGSYRKMVDSAHDELANRGYPGLRSSLHYAMAAIDGGAVTASDLGRALAVSKQAAAKTIAALVERGYVAVDEDPSDGRRRSLRVTQLGREATREGESIFDELRRQWAERVGSDELERMEAHLSAFVGAEGISLKNPGSASRD